MMPIKRYLKIFTATLLTTSIGAMCYGVEPETGAQVSHSTEKVMPAKASLNLQIFTGHWQGELKVSEEQSIDFIFNISQSPKGLVASLDVPSQHQFGLDFDTVTQKGNSISLVLTAAGIEYYGDLVNGKIQGEYQQGGFKAPVVLVKRQAPSVRQPKPQDPSATPDYLVETVTFPNQHDGHTLAGTLTIPKGEFQYSVIILSGSGPTQRDGAAYGHKLYAVLADQLTKNGIAVLRFDDRGVGESGGDYATATSRDFANDASAALQFMHSHVRVSNSKIGYVGHSEGSLIGAIAMTNKAAVKADFFISLAGPGTSGGHILIDQSYLIQKARGIPSEQLEKSDHLQRQIIAAIENKAPVEQLEQLLAQSGMSTAQIRAQVSQLSSPWMTYFINTDPKVFLRQIKVPVLAINGGKDLQVPARQNIEGFIQSIDKDLLSYKIYPNLNHLLQPAVTGLPSEYASIQTTLSAQVIKDIQDWLVQ
jgi:fermentation-respiration switch protein FrsA (DUF1100 family)